MSDVEIKAFAKEMMETLKKYKELSYKKAIWQMSNSMIPFIAIWIAMYWAYSYNLFLFFGLGILNAFFLVRIFIIQHDCGHHSFVKSKKWRDAIGFVCSVFSAMPYKYWAESHAFHHNNNGMLEVRDIGDINTLTVKEYSEMGSWDKMKYKIFRFPIITFFVGPAIYMIRNMRYPLVILASAKKAHWSVWMNNLVIIGILTTLCILFDWRIILATYFTVLYSFSIIAIWFFFVQHQHENGYKRWENDWTHFVSSIKGSTYYKLPVVLNWFTGNIGVHHIHHLYPAIPNYNLLKCIKQNPSFSKYTTIVTFWESLKYMNHKLWDESTQRMITFGEYNKMHKLA
jgi:omega-6 fatty acid desaturase (delta-12 desaturase)